MPPLRILVVDDDEDTRALAADLLRSTGAHTVTLAATAESALADLCAGFFDLTLPEWAHGVEVTRATC